MERGRNLQQLGRTCTLSSAQLSGSLSNSRFDAVASCRVAKSCKCPRSSQRLRKNRASKSMGSEQADSSQQRIATWPSQDGGNMRTPYLSLFSLSISHSYLETAMNRREIQDAELRPQFIYLWTSPYQRQISQRCGLVARYMNCGRGGEEDEPTTHHAGVITSAIQI